MTTHGAREEHVEPEQAPLRRSGSTRQGAEQAMGNAAFGRMLTAGTPPVVHSGLSSAGNMAVARLMRADRPGDVTEAPADFGGRLGTESGHEIPSVARQELETGLGVPLGDVRVHTGPTAAEMAAQVNAHAFTVGQDIYFGRGEYDPVSTEGYRLLAHEVTHTVQQSNARQMSSRMAVSTPQDQSESDAREVADHLVAHRGTGAGPVEVEQAPVVVARHDSWEHTLLGDTPPAELAGATGTGPAVTVGARKHLLTELWERTAFFAQNPGGDPRTKFPNVRWIQFSTSELWVSNGEVNALADYLPDPGAADSMTRDELLPVLQKMRSGTMHNTGNPYGMNIQVNSGFFEPIITDRADTDGMATSWLEYISEAGGEVKALDNATAAEGMNRYAGLLSRNACHFAPFSWHRWEEYHNQAVEHAQQHFASRNASIPLNSVPKDTEEHARQAILNNGYADHFLQDSFAAGHLVNKTLVMQWWVDYVNQEATDIPFTDYQIVRRGAPDSDVRARMGSARQRNIAGQELYHRPPTEGWTDEMDREVGISPTDPQSAQERRDRYQREGGSGVTGVDEADREANYQAYLRLLNNAQAQGAAGAVHDYFNARGVTVTSSDGTLTMRVGGDDTMLAKSDAVGTQAAASAATLSRKMIEEIMDFGTSSITFQDIFALVPTSVVVADVPVPLDQWQDQVLHDLCFSTIFPDYYSTLKSAIIGAFGSEMVDGGISPDAGRAAPPAPPIGDFPLPMSYLG
jgi:hypothetical protein